MLAYDARLITDEALNEQERIKNLMSDIFNSIKHAASKGKFSIEYNGLDDEQIKILNEYGYLITCQEIDLDGNYITIIDWKNPK